MTRLLTKGIGYEQPFIDEWTETSLGSLILLQRGHDLPNALRHPGTIPIIGANGITGYHDSAKARGPGVLIGRSGTLGKVYYIEGDYWQLNTSLYVKEFHNCDPLFMYYFLHTLQYERYNAGTTVQTMNRNLLHPINVRIPRNIEEQQKIALILSRVDELIQKLQLERANYEILKKGLLQQLLTGKIRVKV